MADRQRGKLTSHDNFLGLVQHTVKKIYGSEGLKFKAPRSLSDEQLKMVEHAVDMVMDSPYSTVRGYKELKKRQFGDLVDKLDIDVDENKLEKVFNSEYWEKTRELLDRDSDVAILFVADYLNDHHSAQSAIKQLQKFVEDNDTSRDFSKFFE